MNLFLNLLLLTDFFLNFRNFMDILSSSDSSNSFDTLLGKFF